MAFVYPTNAELKAIAQIKLPALLLNDPIFQLFPIRPVDSPVIAWEQRDNYFGLQQVRGLGGPFAGVQAVGGGRYTMEPGYYGEFRQIDEVQMTLRRPYGQFNGSVPISDLVMEAQDHLMHREVSRIRYILWTLLVTGTFSVALPTGGVAHTDTYTMQTNSASDWSTLSTGTPLKDFRAMALLSRGYSTSFGRNATAFMNRQTANYLLDNTNSSDIGGKRVSGGNSINDWNETNRILLDADLPQIVIMDDGYYNDSNSFAQFIAVDKVVVVGPRDNGNPVGYYSMTRNVNNDDMSPGSYTEVVETRDPPRTVNVYQGHNGGPEMHYPSSVVVMSV